MYGMEKFYIHPILNLTFLDLMNLLNITKCDSPSLKKD